MRGFGIIFGERKEGHKQAKVFPLAARPKRIEEFGQGELCFNSIQGPCFGAF